MQSHSAAASGALESGPPMVTRCSSTQENVNVCDLGVKSELYLLDARFEHK